MNDSRRKFLKAFGISLPVSLSGCNSLSLDGQQEYVPVVMENDHTESHMMSTAITTIPDRGLGFTEYFSEVWLVESGGTHTFNEGLAFTDYEPDLMVLTVLDDETARRTEFSFDFDLRELRISVTENGEIDVQSRN